VAETRLSKKKKHHVFRVCTKYNIILEADPTATMKKQLSLDIK
jgi:hypothetical protein